MYMYSHTLHAIPTNPPTTTGEGNGLPLDAGAEAGGVRGADAQERGEAAAQEGEEADGGQWEAAAGGRRRGGWGE